MALATTTLSSAVAVTDNSINVASVTSLAPLRFVQVDQEMMQVSKAYVVGAANPIPVYRGVDGTVTLAHKVTANVVHGLAADWALNAPQQVTVLPVSARPVICQSITATSTLTLPPAGCDLRVMLNGTSVITLTIPVPTKELDFCRLTICGNGAAAHLVTFTGGLSGAGSSYDVITVNATAPIAVEAMAANGLWNSIVNVPMAGTVTNITGTVA